MAHQYLYGTAQDQPMDRRQLHKKRKPSNWFRSIIAAAAMLAVSSLGAVLVFDWYFFSLVDGLSLSLRPIAGVFRQTTGDTSKNAGNVREARKAARKDFTVPLKEPSHRANSLFLPVNSELNAEAPN